jgi:chromosome segregation ATPase
MNRFLSYFNFAGVIALAILCAVQWRTNSLLNQEVDHLEKTRLEQTAKIAEQDQTIQGDVADLDDFRRRLMISESALKKSDDQLATATTQRDRATAERDQLKAALDQWIAAVAARDAALKQAGQQLQKTAAERNDAVVKFNDLAGKYNAVVKDLNEARTKP